MTERLPPTVQRVESESEELVRPSSETIPMADIGLGLNHSKSHIEEEKTMLTPTGNKLSYTNMAHLWTSFKDEPQVRKLEDMLEYIRLEVEKKREALRKLEEENLALRRKFKE